MLHCMVENTKFRKVITVVGMRISRLRKGKNMTQRDLARVLNLSPSAVGMYEQGRRQPSAELIVAICREFSVSTQWLLTGEPYTRGDFQADLRMLLQEPLPEENDREEALRLQRLLAELEELLAESVII